MKTQKTKLAKVGLEHGFWPFTASLVGSRDIREMDGVELNNLALVLREKLKKVERELSIRNHGLDISR